MLAWLDPACGATEIPGFLLKAGDVQLSMSGIELAGLILGAIPLVIAALENYEDGLGKVKAFWKWEDQLSDAIRKLWYQYTSYELTIRVLLASITDDVELEAMLGDPSSKLWADPTIESRLRERLTTAYKPYLYTVADIESAISQIAVSLNLERSNEVLVLLITR